MTASRTGPAGASGAWDATRRKASRVVHRGRLLSSRLGLAAPRHRDPYATHVPVLVGIGSLLRPRTVLELGCGEYSTGTFLDRDVFPSLERLDSYETDPGWAAKVRGWFGADERLGLHLVDGRVAEAVAALDLEPYDLVFVDDSTTAEHRAATIATVAAQCRPDAVVAIHDFEVQPYREASLAFGHRFALGSFSPQTGLCSQRKVLSRKDVRALDRRIRASRHLDPLDRAGWAVALGER